jgi:hypothetical protein
VAECERLALASVLMGGAELPPHIRRRGKGDARGTKGVIDENACREAWSSGCPACPARYAAETADLNRIV